MSVAAARQGTRKRTSAKNWGLITGIGMIVAVGVFTVVPLLLTVLNSFSESLPGRPTTYSLDAWGVAFSNAKTVSSIGNTVVLAITYTSISLAMAIVFAWLIARTDLPFANFIEFMLWLAFFLPALPMVIGWIALLDPDYGVINTAIRKIPFVGESPLSIYGFWGIVWAHLATASVGIKVIMLTPAFRRMGAPLEEAARVCGANQLRTMLKVTLPVLAPAILVSAVMGLIHALETFEIELLLGMPTNFFVFSTRIFFLIRQDPPQYAPATALSTVFLVALLGLALFYQRYIKSKQFVTVTGHSYSSARIKLGRWRPVALAACFLYIGVAIAMPLTMLLLGSFMRRFGFFEIKSPYTLDHWRTVLHDSVFVSSVTNSLIIGLSAAAIGVLAYSILAYAILRGRMVGRDTVDILAWLPWSVPGILLGMGLLWLYLGTPALRFLYGSLLGLTVAMLIRGLPSGTQLMKSAILQVSRDLEEGARVCGAGWLYTYFRILLPLLAPMVVSVAVIVLVASLKDVAVGALLYSPASRPLSLLMLEYGYGGEMEKGAVVGIIISALVAVIALIARVFGLQVRSSS